MKTHWKKLDNPNYLGAYSLMDGETKELTLTIKQVVTEEVKTDRGSDMCRVVHFVEKQKPMILNTTNSKTIEGIYETPYIEDWKGKKVTIFVAKIKAFGEQLDALRIRKTKPALPELKPDTEKWGGALQALANGYTIEQIEAKYRISAKNRETLIAEAV